MRGWGALAVSLGTLDGQIVRYILDLSCRSGPTAGGRIGR
jgi:hypothetical protein